MRISDSDEIYSRRKVTFPSSFQIKQTNYSPSIYEGLANISSMKIEHISWFRSPVSKLPLQLKDDRLVSETGEIYAIENGIPLLSTNADSITIPKKDLPQLISSIKNKFLRWFNKTDHLPQCSHFIQEMSVHSNSTILIIGITQGNSLRFFPTSVNCWAIAEKLDDAIRCKSNLEKWEKPSQILVADPGHLPFAEAIFDFVWLKNGIKNNELAPQALREAIRVCKPGGKIVLSIQSTELSSIEYASQALQTALGMIPPGSTEISIVDDAEIQNYCLSFC
ncbi:MAG: class I SAM-dependent methyltransferase, partial [Bacteroidia bacterium]|nr:class I SAM-dependent methyltransferase [Bacteroidia bacterium]